MTTRIALLFLLTSLLLLNTANAQWQKLAFPSGGYIEKTEAIKDAPNTWYAIGNQTLYTSTNSGQLWTMVNTNMFISDFSFGLKNFVTADSSLFLLSGNTLTKVEGFHTSSQIIGIKQLENNIIVACRNDINFNLELMISHDTGSTWISKVIPEFDFVLQVIPAIHEGRLKLIRNSSGTIKVSTDTANTWIDLSPTWFASTSLNDITWNDNKLLLLTNDSNVLYTNTLQDTLWTIENQGLNTKLFYNKFITAGPHLFAKTGQGPIWRLHNNQWVSVKNNIKGRINHIGFTNGQLLVSTPLGIAVSSDTLASASTKNNGLAHHFISSICFDDDNLLLTTSPGIFKSTPTHPDSLVLFDTASIGISRIRKFGSCYIAQTSQLFLVSYDGIKWTDRTPIEFFPDGHTLSDVIIRTNPAFTGELILLISPGGLLFHTADTGNTWKMITGNPPQGIKGAFKGDSLVIFSFTGNINFLHNDEWTESDSIRPELSNPMDIITVPFGTYASSSGSTVFKFAPNWSDATPVDLGIPDSTFGAISITAHRDTLFVLQANQLKYTANGTQWHELSLAEIVSPFNTAFQININLPYVYLTTSQGLYRTTLRSLISNTREIAEEKPTFTLYPNPGSGRVFISGEPNQPLQVRVFDLNGRLHYQGNTISNNWIDMTSLPKGLSIIQITGKDGTSFTKFIKE